MASDNPDPDSPVRLAEITYSRVLKLPELTEEQQALLKKHRPRIQAYIEKRLDEETRRLMGIPSSPTEPSTLRTHIGLRPSRRIGVSFGPSDT